MSKKEKDPVEILNPDNLPEDLWHWYYVVYQTKSGVDTAEIPVKWPIRSMKEISIISNMIGERLDVRTVIVTNFIHLRIDKLPEEKEADQG